MFPAIWVMIGLILIGVIPVYADYIELWNLRLPYEKPNVCFFEPQEPVTNGIKEYILPPAVFGVMEWEYKLNNYTKSWDYNMTYTYIDNKTHFNKKFEDFKQCSVFISFWDDKPDGVLGITHYNHKNSNHKYAAIEIYPVFRMDNGTLATFPPDYIRTIVAHEFGHALGIGHHNKTLDNNFDSILVPVWDLMNPLYVTEDDVKAAVQLYGKGGFKKEYRDVPDDYVRNNYKERT